MRLTLGVFFFLLFNLGNIVGYYLPTAVSLVGHVYLPHMGSGAGTRQTTIGLVRPPSHFPEFHSSVTVLSFPRMLSIFLRSCANFVQMLFLYSLIAAWLSERC